MGKKIRKRFNIEIDYPFEHKLEKYNSYYLKGKWRKKLEYNYIHRTFLRVYVTPISGKRKNTYDEFPSYGFFDKSIICYPKKCELIYDELVYRISDIKLLIQKALETYSENINKKKLILFIPLLPKSMSYHKWLVPKYHFKVLKRNSKKVTQKDVIDCFCSNLLLFREDFGELFIEEESLVRILTNLISIATQFESSEKISLSEINTINKTKEELQLPYNAVTSCLNFIFENLLRELKEASQIISCLNCGKYSQYFRTKKFCSNICLRRYHSRKDYYKHIKKRLPVKRRWIQQTRREIPHY